jgi:hypothetical protein
VNTATATGGDPGNNSVQDASDAVTVYADQQPSLTINKVLDTDVSGGIAVNDLLTYTITVTNTGNITLNNVEVTDDKITPASNSCASVAPGATCILTGTYTVTQADMDAGEIVNTATGDSDEAGPETDVLITTIDPQPTSIVITKIADPSDQLYSAVGDVLTYLITVENTGLLTISNIEVTDPNADTSPLVCTNYTLAPGESMTCVAEHTITAGDLNLPFVSNTASVSGEEPGGNPVGDVSQQIVLYNNNLIPTAYAGPDLTVCQGTNPTLSLATATQYGALEWTSDGTGTFDDNTSLNPVYTPSSSDILDGEIELTLTAYPNPPGVIITSDQMTLTIIPKPLVNAGDDITVCAGDTAHIIGTASNVASVICNKTGDRYFCIC